MNKKKIFLFFLFLPLQNMVARAQRSAHSRVIQYHDYECIKFFLSPLTTLKVNNKIIRESSWSISRRTCYYYCFAVRCCCWVVVMKRRKRRIIIGAIREKINTNFI